MVPLYCVEVNDLKPVYSMCMSPDRLHIMQFGTQM